MRIIGELDAWYSARLESLAQDAERLASRMRLVDTMTENELWTSDGVEGKSQMKDIRDTLSTLHDDFLCFVQDVERSTGVAAPDGLTVDSEDK